MLPSMQHGANAADPRNTLPERLIGMKYLLTLVFDYDAQKWAAEYGLPASEAAGDFTAAMRRAVEDGSLIHALDAAWPMMRGHLSARTVERLDADLRDELLHKLRAARDAGLDQALLNEI